MSRINAVVVNTVDVFTAYLVILFNAYLLLLFILLLLVCYLHYLNIIIYIMVKWLWRGLH